MMNGDDDPTYRAPMRRVPPPPGRPGDGPPPRRAAYPPPHRPPNPGPPDRRMEPTRRIPRDPQQAPLAWSQAPPEPIGLRKPPPQAAAPRHTHAPTQQPEPFHDAAPPLPPKRSREYRQGTPPPPSAPPRRDQPARPPRPRRKRRWGRWFLVFLLLLVIGSVVGVFKLDGSLNRIDALAGYTNRVGDTPGTNWLLVGSDSRAGLSPDQEQELATGGSLDSERTDTIMLVHIPKSGRTTLVSLPRDSYVSIPGYGQDKLNASFAFGGPQLLVQTVEIATGLHIDHYAQIGFGGFAGVVDSLGGIDVCLDEPINDPLAGINLPAGCQKLSGPEALGFVRTRATPRADLDRVKNQRLFMSALLDKATGLGTLLNPFKLWPLAGDIAKSLKVDEGDHIWDLARLGWAMRSDLIATTVPVGGAEDTDSGNVLLWDDTKAPKFFEALVDDQPIPEDLLTR